MGDWKQEKQSDDPTALACMAGTLSKQLENE